MLLGEVNDAGVPQAALVHFGSEAYEHYMVAPYVRELLMVRNSDYVCWSPYFEHLYAAILALGEANVQFEELGSTLFSSIDKLDKLDATHQCLSQPSRLCYVGIEIIAIVNRSCGCLTSRKEKPSLYEMASGTSTVTEYRETIVPIYLLCICRDSGTI